MTLKHVAVALVALYVLVYIVPLGVRPLSAPDETRYAEIPREMIESGNWVSPHLSGLRYFEKPPLGYWVTAASIMAFGRSGFAVRLPSAVSVGLTALLIFLLIARTTGRARAGLLASAVYLTSLEVFALGVTNVLDSPLTLFLTAAMASFFWAHFEKRPRQHAALMALFGVFCGLAFLTKGFLGLAIPALVVAPFLLLEKRWRELLRAPWLPIASALAIVLPWSLLIHFEEPDFWRYFFWVEHVSRFLNPEGPAQHAEPFWFFVPLLIGSMVLWIPLVPAVISGFRSDRTVGPLVRYAGLWFLGPFLFLSASSGKLGTYILPCFPPLAILIGIGLDRFLEGERRSLFTVGAVASGVLGLSAGAFVAISQLGGSTGDRWFGPDESWKWTTIVAVFAAWGILSLLAAARTRHAGAVWLYCCAPALFLFSVGFVIPDSSADGKMPEDFILEHAQQVPPDAQVFADTYLLHAVCWYLERSDVSIVGKEGELGYGLSYADAAHRSLPDAGLGALLLAPARTRGVVVIVDSEHLETLLETRPSGRPLPEPEVRVEGDGFALARFGPRP